MKKIMFSLLIFAVPVLAHAQSLPNADFENWRTDSTGYMEPMGWNTSNQQTAAVGGVTVEQSTSAHSGNFAASMSTTGVGTSPVVYYAGLMTNGSFLNTGGAISIIGGTPFNYVPDTVSFYYKYQSGQSDSGVVTINFYRRVNGTTRTLVGGGQIKLPAVSSYTKASIRMGRDSLHTQPDSVLIVFQSCRDLANPKNGQLTVDDITMGGNTAINEVAHEADIQVDVYPNPASNFINLSTPNELAAAEYINIYSTDGRLIKAEHNSSELRQLQIATDQLPTGNYVVKLHWADGSFVHRNIIVAK